MINGCDEIQNEEELVLPYKHNGKVLLISAMDFWDECIGTQMKEYAIYTLIRKGYASRKSLAPNHL